MQGYVHFSAQGYHNQKVEQDKPRESKIPYKVMVGNKKVYVYKNAQPIYPAMDSVSFFAAVFGKDADTYHDVCDHNKYGGQYR